MSTADGETGRSPSAQISGSRNNPDHEWFRSLDGGAQAPPSTWIRASDLAKRRLTWEAAFRYHPGSRLRRMVGLAFTRQQRRRPVASGSIWPSRAALGGADLGQRQQRRGMVGT